MHALYLDITAPDNCYLSVGWWKLTFWRLTNDRKRCYNSNTSFWRKYIMHALILLCINQHAKFELSIAL